RPDDDLARLRLDVQVGGAVVYGSGEELVDELDCRRARSRVGDVVRVGEGRVGRLVTDVQVDVDLAAIGASDGAGDGRRRGDGEAHVQPEREPQVVGGEDVHRICDR